MKKYAFSLAAIAALLLGAVTASASPIPVGGVNTFDGFLTEWNMGPGGDLPSSTCTGGGSLCYYTDYVGVTPSSQSGSLAAVTTASLPPSIVYSPTTGSNGFVWDFCTGTGTCGTVTNPVVITFTVTGPVTITFINQNFFNVSAPGVWNEAGYQPTTGSFSVSATDSNNLPNGGDYGQSGVNVGGTESFNVLGTVYTPEPSSLVLLGTGLLGAAFLLFRRNRAARAGSIA